MPPRLNKRQMRELQELEELEKSRAASTSALPTFDEVTDSEGEAEVVAQPRSAGGFGALDLGQEDEDEEQEEDEEESTAAPTKAKKSKNKKKKKKAKPAAESPDAATPDSPATPQPQLETPSKQGKGKKKKQQQQQQEPVVDDGMDEIDRALAELAVKGGDAGRAAMTTGEQLQRVDPKWAAVKDVFSFDTKYLDSDAELRRMFGSKVIGNTPQAPRSHLHARFANNPHHSTSIRRTSSYLATPEPGWPSPSGVLGLARYDGPEANMDPSGDWNTYVHSPSYKQAQLMFLEVLQQADGNRLWDVLAAQPYHIDALMQLSEMMVQQGDLGASSTYLSRALYALSAPLPATFSSGTFRLPYSQIENRAFFLGIARKVAILVKRGTWRTAFEFAKIGLGVGGGADPVGMLCWIDFLAPKAGQNDWFLKFVPAMEVAYPEMRVTSYPGLAYAKALVLRNMEEEKKENNDKSTEALKSAIIRFPMVATLLSNSLAFDLPPKMVSHRRAQLDGTFTKNPSYLLSLLSELYVARSAPLWKDPASLAWLRKSVNAAAPSLDDSSLEDVRIGEKLWSQGPWEEGFAPAGVVRAAFISEIPSVRPYLPPSARSGTFYSYDPLPPDHSSATFYDDNYFSSLYSAGGNSRRRRGNLPPPRAGGGAQQGGAGDVAAALRDGLARLLGMGPAGPEVDLNPELRAELLREFEALGGAGEMPGGFGEGDESDSDYEDVDEGEEGPEETEEERMENTRNILGRLGALFGGGGGGGAAPPPAEEEGR